jgi:hypothetical protein
MMVMPVNLPRMADVRKFRPLAEKNIPECAGFSFVFKAGIGVHAGYMCGKAQRRRAMKGQSGGYVFRWKCP